MWLIILEVTHGIQERYTTFTDCRLSLLPTSGATGVAALQQLRTTTQYTGPIIAMSATLQKADLFLSAGATAYLAKPFTIEGLLTLVQQYVKPQPTVGAFV
jgi:CheY-like chemotaxis protein